MERTLSNHYILILCGGSGPRLWPLSRAHRPKQFLPIITENSLLKDTFHRAEKIVPRQNIFVISHHKYHQLIKDDLKNLLASHNLISEPDKKNTAMAILYATTIISQINPRAVVTTFTSDHFIGNLPKFTKQINLSFKLASHQPTIVTFGIAPHSPSTSFGYLLVGKAQQGIYAVKNFIEKPPLTTAEKLMRSGKSYWNSGIYTFSVETILSQFKVHAPKYYSLYQSLLNNPQQLLKIYQQSPVLSIDVAISEKSKDLQMIPAEFVWNDVGEWKSIYRQLSQKSDGVVSLHPSTEYVQVGSKKCLVSAPKGKLIGLVDVNNLAVIDTPDALLICNIAYNGSYEVRNLVTKIVNDPQLKKYFLSKDDK